MPAAVVVLIVVASVVIGPSTPGAAIGGHDDPDRSSVVVSTPSPETIGVAVRSDGRRSSTVRCSWRVVPIDTHRGRVPADPELVRTHRLYDRHSCTDPARNTYVWVPIASVAGTLVPVLRDAMVARLPRPDPVLTPLRPPGWVIVGLPLDIRIDPDDWRPIRITASVGGPDPVYATATATPVALEFQAGDPTRPGDGIRCTGTDPVAGYDPARPGRCSYTYRTASSVAADGATFPARLLIHWRVEYQSSVGGGLLTVEPTATTRPLAVAEIQALVSCVGVEC